MAPWPQASHFSGCIYLSLAGCFFPHVAVWFLLFECLCVVLHTDGAALCDCSKLCLSAIHATMKALSTGKWVFYFFNATWTFLNSLQGFSVNRKQEAGFSFFFFALSFLLLHLFFTCAEIADGTKAVLFWNAPRWTVWPSPDSMHTAVWTRGVGWSLNHGSVKVSEGNSTLLLCSLLFPVLLLSPTSQSVLILRSCIVTSWLNMSLISLDGLYFKNTSQCAGRFLFFHWEITFFF